MRELSPRYNTLLDHIPGMAYHCRNDWKHTLEYASKGCHALTGFQPEDLVSNQVAAYGDLILPEDRNLVWMNLQNAFAHKKPFELVYRIRTRSQEIRWVCERGVKILGDEENTQLLEGFITDITEWKTAQEQVKRQVGRFQALRTIDSAISASPNLHFTLEILLEQIISQLNVDAAAILLHRGGSKTLEYESCRGFRSEAILHTRIKIGTGLAGKAAKTRQPVLIKDLSSLNGDAHELLPVVEEGFKLYYGLPLIAKGQVKGVLEIFMRKPRLVDQEWSDFMEALAGQAAIAIDNSTLFEQLQDSNSELSIAYDATLEGWAKALELRDRETVGHAHRVIEMTLRMAAKMGINGEAMQHIRRGALLHDIGKMGIPDSILLKPGPLTPDEWHTMRQHPIHAYNMLKAIDYLEPALEIPYCHHEKWDGSGYPRGLVRTAIPISARIFAVVDVWDALTSDRPYRRAWSEANALEYIRMESGRHFDPQVAAIFLSH